MVDDKASRWGEAVRPEPAAVAVASADQQVGASGGLHHLAFDAAAAFEAGNRPAEQVGGGCQEVLSSAGGHGLDTAARIALGWVAAA
jgi:hypothetical protein